MEHDRMVQYKDENIYRYALRGEKERDKKREKEIRRNRWRER